MRSSAADAVDPGWPGSSGCPVGVRLGTAGGTCRSAATAAAKLYLSPFGSDGATRRR